MKINERTLLWNTILFCLLLLLALRGNTRCQSQIRNPYKALITTIVSVKFLIRWQYNLTMLGFFDRTISISKCETSLGLAKTLLRNPAVYLKPVPVKYQSKRRSIHWTKSQVRSYRIRKIQKEISMKESDETAQLGNTSRWDYKISNLLTFCEATNLGFKDQIR